MDYVEQAVCLVTTRYSCTENRILCIFKRCSAGQVRDEFCYYKYLQV